MQRKGSRAELHNPEKVKEDKFLKIIFSDIDFSILGKTENIYDVEKYLQNNGVDFYIQGNDLIDRFPGLPINKYLPFNNDTRLGIIKGGNIKEIKTKIKDLINRLKSKESAAVPEIPSKLEVKVQYNVNLGQFIFNDDRRVEFEGKQKDVTDCLVSGGKDHKVSWDEINERMGGESDLNEHGINLAKKSVNGAVSEINKKTEKYLESGKLLIGFKDNEYWLHYRVDTDG